MIVKAFTVHEAHDEHHTYWIVPLHDYEPVNQNKVAMQLFHSKEEALRFAEAQRDKLRQ